MIYWNSLEKFVFLIHLYVLGSLPRFLFDYNKRLVLPTHVFGVAIVAGERNELLFLLFRMKRNVELLMSIPTGAIV